MSHAALLIAPAIVADSGRAWHPPRTRSAAIACGAIRRTNTLHPTMR